MEMWKKYEVHYMSNVFAALFAYFYKLYDIIRITHAIHACVWFS